MDKFGNLEMRCEPHWQGELANLEMRKFGNEVNTNNARNANNTKQSTLPKVRAAQAVVARRAVEN